MKFHRNKFLTTAAAVALMLAVGACSSSSDDDETVAATPPPATTDPAPDPTPEQTPAQQLAAANAALETAQGLVDALTSSSTPEEAAEAYAALGTAQAAVHAATNLPENQINALQAQINQLTSAALVWEAVATATSMVDALTDDSDATAVTAARDAVTAAQTVLAGAMDLPQDASSDLDTLISSLDTRLLVVETEVASRPTEAQIAAAAARTKAAGTKMKAINAEGVQDPDAGIGGSVETGVDSTYSMTIERPRSGTEVKITDSAVAGMDDPKFALYMDLGEGRTMHTRTMEADDDGNVVEEVVIVSTDIAAPKATAFAKVAGQMLNARDLDDEVNADNTGSATDDWTALTVDGSSADVVALVKSAAFSPGQGTSVTHTFARYQMDSDNTMDGDQTIAAFETAGTYNGAMGTYRCNDASDDCTVTVNAKGAVTEMTEIWVFTPNAGATSDVADANYLSYGFWLKKTTDEDGVLTYNEVETFTEAVGHPATVDNDLSSVVGSATYDGSAVGVYVKNVLDDQANITSATSGHFVADAELNANFGGGGVAANDQFTIGGKITGFVLQHGEENDWEVGLGLTDLSGRTAGNEPGKSAPGSDHAGAFSGVATGDSTAAAGSWNGVFYGSSAAVDHDMDNATPNINPQPVAVIGEFNANFTDGTTAGAYGANK